MRERLEYAAVWLLLKTIGAMPRPLARFVGARTAAFLFWMRPGLRSAAAENLKLAFPAWSKKQRRAAIRGMVRQLGWMAAEFAHFPRYTKNNIERIVLLDGFENFATAQAQGKGVLFLTGHMSAWETGSLRAGALSEIRCIFWSGPSTIRAWTRSSRNIDA